MQETSLKNERRRRLDNISKVLRRFGLTDPGDISDVLGNSPFPSTANLERLLRSLNLRLPPSITPLLIAQALLVAVDEVSPATTKWRESFGEAPNLKGIATGKSQAGNYHRTIFNTLIGIFEGSLSNGKIEQEINTGIHRVDIMFDNFAEVGFFADLRSRLDLPSNHVPIECKNYSDDLNSPEYDQLSGRLSDKVGRVGLLVFRKIGDQKKALEHRKAKWEKRELIIMLHDKDILQMHKARHDGRLGDVDKLLWDKVRQLQLNSVT